MPMQWRLYPEPYLWTTLKPAHYQPKNIHEVHLWIRLDSPNSQLIRLCRWLIPLKYISEIKLVWFSIVKNKCDLVELITLKLHLWIHSLQFTLLCNEIKKEQRIFIDTHNDILWHQWATCWYYIQIILYYIRILITYILQLIEDWHLEHQSERLQLDRINFQLIEA